MAWNELHIMDDYVLYTTRTLKQSARLPLKFDAWKTIRLPFGGWQSSFANCSFQGK